ncbi:MAG: ABC transporter substrate-binding protein [Alphaproteobacteria bacterium]|nr:ABC transporter substrate-binding protein [Alphaproteobacteria bacterium]
METRANYLLVGSFVLLIVAGTVVFILWLAKFQFDQQFTRYDIHFPGSVSGLKVGSTVELNGIPAGEVIDIRIDPDDVEQVKVTIEVPAETPVRENTLANLQLKGITGGVSIQLTGGTQQAPPLRPRPGEKRALIASQSSTLEQFLEGAPELMEGLQTLLARAAALLGPDNQNAFSQILANAAALSGALAARTEDIELLITEASGTMANLKTASEAMQMLAVRAETTLASVGDAASTVSSTVEVSQPDIVALIKDLRNTSESITQMTREMNALVEENRPPLRDFTGEGLYELTGFLTEARALIDGLERVATQVERDPARFLFGNQQQGYETPN